ncbi:UNVERIFIED_CONTAM: hypothetical protein H355_016897 [Colinus virginianus]|nr:hypothetical protein H355_016897 [Colinus virginianus]
MAAPMELSCWGGDWGLPSLHPESLTVMAYAKFSGAPLTVNTINNSWSTPKADVPVLISEDIVISQPAKILNFLRKQRYNADYELSAKQGADTLAYIALLEEKLLPALIYRDAKECLNLLSKRLGTSQFFFGNTPTTLDAFVFGFLAPVYKVCFPRVQLQEHLKQLTNLCRFCDDILTCYFRLTVTDPALIISLQMDDNLRKSPQHPPRKITTLKLAAGGEESGPTSRLSP